MHFRIGIIIRVILHNTKKNYDEGLRTDQGCFGGRKEEEGKPRKINWNERISC